MRILVFCMQIYFHRVYAVLFDTIDKRVCIACNVSGLMALLFPVIN